MGTRLLIPCARTCFISCRRLSATASLFKSAKKLKMSYTAIERGSPNTGNYRVFFQIDGGAPISPFHDIPLLADAENQYFNMVVEIPRWSNAKMEINKDEPLNPIKQDVKNGKLRYVKNVFPHHGYIWNYGALPQTYEDPGHITADTGCKGDSDPLDVCEIGTKIHPRGSVVPVKVLGVMCLIDEGETDWKIIAIDASDALAPMLNDIQDVEKQCPGLLRATYEWFKYYKVPDGKPENRFAFDGEAKNKDYALQVIQDTNNQWRELINSPGESSISRINCTVENSPSLIDVSEAKAILEKSPALGPGVEISQDENRWYYVIPKQ
ncbi:Inorganic pyrophosphatase [Bulinus truncatus]|nr:Inorganic pyrophosphatase [Bulinus truncatus]